MHTHKHDGVFVNQYKVFGAIPLSIKSKAHRIDVANFVLHVHSINKMRAIYIAETTKKIVCKINGFYVGLIFRS